MKISTYLNNVILIKMTLACAPFFYFQTWLKKENPQKRILVIQLAKIGDVICSTPVFRAIKKKYPDSYLAVLVIDRAQGVLAHNPYVDEIIVFDMEKNQGLFGVIKLASLLSKKGFNWSFSLLPGIYNNLVPFWAGIKNRAVTTSKYATQGAKISSIFNNYKLEYARSTLALRHYLGLLKFVGIETRDEKKDLFYTDEAKMLARNFLATRNIKESDFLVGISVTAGNKFKEWLPDRFAMLADALAEKYQAKIVFMGARHERAEIQNVQRMMKHQSIDSSQNFSLDQVPALFAKLKLFIAVDTGSIYMANAMGVPVVDIVGPIDPSEQPPLGDKCEIVQAKVPCAPCSFIIPPARKCKKNNPQCILQITVEDVMTAVEKLLTKV